MAELNAIEHHTHRTEVTGAIFTFDWRNATPLPSGPEKGSHAAGAAGAREMDPTVDRSWLAGMLWPDSLEEQSLCNLRRALTDLRSALG